MTPDIRELVRRLRAGETDRAVARDLGVARKTVAPYRSVATAEGWLEGALPAPDDMDRRLGARLTEDDRPHPPNATEPYRAVIEELRRRNVEMAAIGTTRADVFSSAWAPWLKSSASTRRPCGAGSSAGTGPVLVTEPGWQRSGACQSPRRGATLHGVASPRDLS